jgi:hypothetical protein
VTAFVYGKLDPLHESEAPRVKLGDHLATTPAVPAVVDYAGKVTEWPMYMNDSIGDCTCAALAHALEAWTAYAQGITLELQPSDVLNLYEAVSGYNPATGQNDNGAVEQKVLQYVQQYGIGGHKIRAFAQVNHQDLNEMKQALDIFGSVYLGFQVPQSAEQQFGAGQPWTVIPGSPTVGGHAIDLQKWDADYMYPVTWGRLQPMTTDFWLTYGDEAWAIITDDWLDSHTGLSPTGLNLNGLLSEFDEMFGVHQSPKHAGPAKPCPFLNWFKGLLKR